MNGEAMERQIHVYDGCKLGRSIRWNVYIYVCSYEKLHLECWYKIDWWLPWTLCGWWNIYTHEPGFKVGGLLP